MLCSRIWQSRVWASGRRLFRPSVSRSSSVSPEQKAPFEVESFFSGCSSPASPLLSFGFAEANDHIGFNFLHLKKYCFATQPVVDLPAGKIVDVPLAQTGEGIAECELLKWYVQEGDYIEDFQPLCEVQSDKATIEITSRYKGKVANILYVPGDIVKVGETLLKILVDESASPTVTCGDSENAKLPDSDQILVNESTFTTVAFGNLENAKSLDSDPVKGKRAGVLSTPAVRILAKQHGIDINESSLA